MISRAAVLFGLSLLGVLLPSPAAAQWAQPPDTTVRDAFGPLIGDGATTCRGACGGGCHPVGCQQDFYWECVNAHQFVVVRRYDCGTHDGCRTHDDCLDRCAIRFPGSGRDLRSNSSGSSPILEWWLWNPRRNFYVGECSRDCHDEGIDTYGIENTASWVRGQGPFDGRTVFEYTIDAPGRDAPWFRCPDGMTLLCESGRGRCVDDEDGDPEDEEPPGSTPVGVVIIPPALCNDPELPLDLAAEVIGLASDRVTWSLLSGPATVNSNGRLTARGDGSVTVRATSDSDSRFYDEATIYFGRCTCSFSAILTGDTRRGMVQGQMAGFTTRGQFSFLGISAREAEYMEDLAAVGRMAARIGGLAGLELAPTGELDGDPFEAPVDRAQETRRGSSVGIVLIESSSGDKDALGLAGGAKIEVRATGPIEPGFSGALPVEAAALHTGEFASEGGAPNYYLFDPEAEDWPGSVQLFVHEFDGQWMRGQISGHLMGGLLIDRSRRAQLHFTAEFTAGITNPLRMENACAASGYLDGEGDVQVGN